MVKNTATVLAIPAPQPLQPTYLRSSTHNPSPPGRWILRRQPRLLGSGSPGPPQDPSSRPLFMRCSEERTSLGRDGMVVGGVECAMEAVKQGLAFLRSDTHAVVAAANEHSSNQWLVFHVADHAIVAPRGLSTDGRVISSASRTRHRTCCISVLRATPSCCGSGWWSSFRVQACSQLSYGMDERPPPASASSTMPSCRECHVLFSQSCL